MPWGLRPDIRGDNVFVKKKRNLKAPYYSFDMLKSGGFALAGFICQNG